MESYFIPFKNKGGTLVDLDFQSIIHCLNWSKDGRGYAKTHIPLINGKQKNIDMHRLLLDFPKEVDHVNGKRNDNRIMNLRSVTHRENGQNRIEHRNGRLVGACFVKSKNKWKSQIEINGKAKHLGYYISELEAHKSYVNVMQDFTI